MIPEIMIERRSLGEFSVLGEDSPPTLTPPHRGHYVYSRSHQDDLKKETKRIVLGVTSALSRVNPVSSGLGRGENRG